MTVAAAGAQAGLRQVRLHAATSALGESPGQADQAGAGPGMMTGMTMVYLVKHGEKEAWPGDPGLTGLGRQQATRTGRPLSGLGVAALWTSPMRRARKTADCIAWSAVAPNTAKLAVTSG